MEPIFNEIGSLISDRYQLVELLFTGSMSRVFKAWDCSQQYSVIVKIATNNNECQNLVDCLKREALALKHLNHLRIVRLLDCGDVGNSYFVVLEYIHGVDLRKYLDIMGNLSVDTAVSAVIEMLEGLEAMHKEGLVHRDLKPENLMTTRAGIKIIDLGLVKSLSIVESKIISLELVARGLSSPGKAVGTLPYLSPEQARGYEDLDCRSDIYASGVVLYELLTGVLPFSRYQDQGKVLRYWNLPLRSFYMVHPPVDVPTNVQEIVWKALRVDPNLRFQTAEEMRMALLAVLGNYNKIIIP